MKSDLKYKIAHSKKDNAQDDEGEVYEHERRFLRENVSKADQSNTGKKEVETGEEVPVFHSAKDDADSNQVD